MKKLISYVAVLAMALVSLVGCGSDSKEVLKVTSYGSILDFVFLLATFPIELIK